MNTISRTLCSLSLLLLGLITTAPADQLQSTSPMAVARRSHTATVLSDGRVLIVGGQDGSGPLAAAEMFDPGSHTFQAVGGLDAARFGHTATLLSDGRVLISGGQNAAGPLASAEIFDPATATFRTLTATMGATRTGHTATLRSDGTVLLAGGDSAGTAEFFDPVSETFSAPLLTMAEPRAGHTATSLGQDNIFFAGGGTKSTEIFDAASNAFVYWPYSLTETRSGHSVIPATSGSLLVIGGDLTGSFELFDPAAGSSLLGPTLGTPAITGTRLANNKVLVLGLDASGLFDETTGILSPLADSGSTSLQLAGQSVTELPTAHKQILVAGGLNSSSQLVATASIYNPAGVFSDRSDYPPLSWVDITGTGFLPNETVVNQIVQTAGPAVGTAYEPWNVIADTNGGFSTSWLVFSDELLDTTLELSAIGQTSGLMAQTTFTDGPAKIGAVVLGDQSPAQITPGSSANYDVTVYRGDNGNITANLSFTWLSGPSSNSVATPTFAATNLPFGAKGTSRRTTLSISTTAAIVPGTYTFMVRAARSGGNTNDYTTTNGTLVVVLGSSTNHPPTITAPPNQSNAEGDTNISVQVSASDSDGNTLTYGATGLPADLAIDPATGIISGSIDYGTAGSYTVTVTVADGQGGTASANFVWTIGVAGSTTTVTSSSNPSTYGDSVTFTATVVAPSGATAPPNGTVQFQIDGADFGSPAILSSNDVVSSVATSDSISTLTAANHAITAIYSGDTDFGSSTGTLTQQVNQATLTASIIGNPTKTYDGTPAATLTTNNFNLSGLVNGDSFAITKNSGAYNSKDVATATNVTTSLLPGDFIPGSGTSVSNYTLPTTASGPGQITKANASINVTNYSVTYSGNGHTATGSATGVNGESLSVLNLSGTTHTNAGTYASDPWIFTDSSGNYNNTNGTVSDFIGKANASISVTNYSVTYNGNGHTATGSATGVNGESLTVLNLSGTTHTNAGTYASDPWIFTDSSGNYNNTNGTVSDFIGKANASISVTNYSVIYNGNGHTATGSATGVNGESLSVLNLSGTTHTNAGTYASDPWIFTDSSGNYNNTNGTLSDFIGKANASINVTNYSVIYNGNGNTATGSATGVNGESLTILDLSGTTHTNAGTYASDPWIFTDSSGNYNNTNGTLSDFIGKANASISVTNYSVTYNGTGHTATGSATGVNGESLSVLNLSGTTHTNAGTYASDPWNFTDSSGNYNNTNGTVSDYIGKANASISVTNYSVTYDGNGHTATGSATGVNGESLSVLNLSGTTHTNAGTYASDPWIFTDSSGNYNNTNGTVSDFIGKANASISVTNYSVTYNGNGHTAIGSATGVNGESLTVLNLSGTTHTNAGTYASDPWIFTDSSGNYNNTNGTVSDFIGKANASISVTNYSVTYNGNGHTAIGSATGVNGESLTLLNLSGTTHTNAGTYASDPWNFTDSSGNYNNTNGTVSDFIGKANASISVTNYSVTYDGNGHTATGSAKGAKGESLSGLNFNGTVHTNANDYPTDPWTFTDVTGNYNNTNSTVHDYISKANATINVTNYSVFYDGNGHTATGTATGAKGESLSVFDLSGTTHTNVGTYASDPWTFTDTSGNYKNTNGTVSDRILLRPTTITYSGVFTGRFGDCVTATALLIDTLSQTPMTSQVVTLAIYGNHAQSTTTTGTNGLASGTVQLTNAPASLPALVQATASYAGDLTHSAASCTTNFDFEPQLASPPAGSSAIYTGEEVFWTTSASSSAASLALAATVADTTGDCAADITKSRVTFYVSSTGASNSFTPINGATSLPVGPIIPGNFRAGTASSTVQYNIGNNNTITLFLAIGVNGDYTLPSYEVHPVCISRPVPGQITGTGKLDNNNAVGTLPGLVAGTGCSETSVGVAYNKSGANPQGSICVVVNTGTKRYLLKSNAISTFAVKGNTANFSAKCTITDQTTGAGIDGGALMQIAITDNGAGTLDTLSVLVQNQKTGGLWFGSCWSTTQGKVVQKNLIGGNLSVK